MFFSQIRLTLKKGSVKWVILAKDKPYFLKNQIKLAIKIGVYFHVKKMNKEMNKSLCEIEEMPIVQQKKAHPYVGAPLLSKGRRDICYSTLKFLIMSPAFCEISAAFSLSSSFVEQYTITRFSIRKGFPFSLAQVLYIQFPCSSYL